MERAGPALTSAQETLVHLPTEGQFLVRGAAGSGKSTVASARALHLARQPLLHGSPRVLLIARAPAPAPRVEVTTLARWCREYLGRGGTAPEPLAPVEAATLVEAALELVRRRSASRVLRRPVSFFTSEIGSMLLGLGAGRFDDYRPLEREGRGSALEDEARKAVFAVHEEFLALAQAIGRSPPLVLVKSALARLAQERSPPYDHVVVDDAHALAPIELKLVRALAAGGSLTLFAALERKFDPLASSLRDVGLGRLDRTEVLPVPMRGPAPIFAAAHAVLRRRGAQEGDGLRSIRPGTIEGARPRLVLCRDWREELDALVAEVRRRRDAARPLGDVAVLAANGLGLEFAAAELARAGIPAWRLRDEDEGAPVADAVRLCPLHAAAGREFPVVIVLDVNRGAFPRTRAALPGHERATAVDDARRALHLAMTRAKEELVLLATESTRSPLLPMRRLDVETFAAGGDAAAAG